MKEKRLLVVEGESCTVDVNKIPENDDRRIARATLRAVENFFQIPGVKEEYEEWLKDYRKRKADKA